MGLISGRFRPDMVIYRCFGALLRGGSRYSAIMDFGLINRTGYGFRGSQFHSGTTSGPLWLEPT